MQSWRAVGIAAAAGITGGLVGAVLAGIGAHAPERAPASSTGETAHGQDVALCTTYALIDASLHHPVEDGADVLPAIPPLRLALIENPNATPRIREAVADAVAAFDAILARGVKPHGLSEPPAYDHAAVTAALDRVSQACGLGG